jgi:hypothetical protein
VIEYRLNPATAARLKALYAEAQRHQLRFQEAAQTVRVALDVPADAVLDLDKGAFEAESETVEEPVPARREP